MKRYILLFLLIPTIVFGQFKGRWKSGSNAPEAKHTTVYVDTLEELTSSHGVVVKSDFKTLANIVFEMGASEEISLTDGTDTYYILVSSDVLTFQDDAGTPNAIFTIDSTGNVRTYGKFVVDDSTRLEGTLLAKGKVTANADIEVTDQIDIIDNADVDTFYIKVTSDALRIYNDADGVVADFDSAGAFRAGANRRRVFSLSDGETKIRFADDVNITNLDISVGSSGDKWSTFDGNNKRFGIGTNSPSNTFEVNLKSDTLAAFYGDYGHPGLTSADSIGLIILATGVTEFGNTIFSHAKKVYIDSTGIKFMDATDADTSELKDDGTHTILRSDNPVLFTNSYNYFADTSTVSDAYGFECSTITAYVEGMSILLKAGVANDGACTLQINSLGAIDIKSLHDNDPAADYIEAGSIVWLVYDGTNFQILNPDANP